MSAPVWTKTFCPDGAELEDRAYRASQQGRHTLAAGLYRDAAERYRKARMGGSVAFCLTEASREASWYSETHD